MNGLNHIISIVRRAAQLRSNHTERRDRAGLAAWGKTLSYVENGRDGNRLCVSDYFY